MQVELKFSVLIQKVYKQIVAILIWGGGLMEPRTYHWLCGSRSAGEHSTGKLQH